jgi:hypothetical protein
MRASDLRPAPADPGHDAEPVYGLGILGGSSSLGLLGLLLQLKGRPLGLDDCEGEASPTLCPLEIPGGDGTYEPFRRNSGSRNVARERVASV